jgi:regulator of protease activity HflC (stomatin/prohibitin superfamily)
MAIIFKIVPEYQRVVRFTLGRYDGIPRGPGWIWIIPFVHGTITVDLREEVFDVEPQTCITKDNAPVTVDMLVFLRVVDRRWRCCACRAIAWPRAAWRSPPCAPSSAT